ncbi:MAG: tetratricopeptide repeat protein [Bacteroidia bacterium]|nr:tetratricopeptide repeat protein [Bacteroidia bacterium]
MKKAFYIYLIVSVFCSTISFSINSQKNNSEFIPSQCFSFSKAMTDSTKNSDYVSDTLFQSIKKIFLHASNTYKNNNLHVALEFYTQFVNLAISHNYEKYLWQEIRMSFSYMSSINSISLNFEESIRYLKKALEITCKYNPLDLDNIYYFLFNIAKSYYSQNDYTNSLEYYNQSEAIFSSVNSIPINKKAQLYNNLGLCYYKLGMDNESQTYLDESIRIKKILGLFDDLASSYNNIGLVSQNNEKYSEALSYFNKSLFLHDSLKNSIGSAFVNNNIGNLYLDKGSYDTSKYFYQKSLSIRKNQEKINYSDLVISYNNLSFINYKLNNLDSAMFFNGLAMDLNNQELETREQYNYFSISNYLISIADRIEINLSKYHTTNNVKYLTESFSFFQPTVKLFINQLIKYNSIFPVNIFINENKRFFDLSILSSHLLDSINIPECPRSLIVSETYKSLSLLNILSEIRTLHDDSIPFKQFGQLNKYYQWQQCLLQKEKSVSGISTLTLIDSLINNTLEIDFQKIRCLERLRDNLNNYFYNISDSIISNCKNIKDKLLLDYYISSNSIFIHTISKSKISCFVHPATKEFFHAVHKYPKSVKSIDQISTISFSKDLSVYLLSPIAKILDLFSNITIIPDQTIAEIPFESLPYTEGESVKKQYLV